MRHASKSLTKENIILNCVAPGNVFFKGGVWDKNLKKNKAYYKKYIKSEVPENRLANPEEIANLVVYLCSEESTFINGSIIFCSIDSPRFFSYERMLTVAGRTFTLREYILGSSSRSAKS